MKNKDINILFLSLISMAVLTVSCKNNALTNDQEIQKEVALKFVNSYIEFKNTEKNEVALAQRAADSPLVTEAFKSDLLLVVEEQKADTENLDLDYDPLLDMQKYPEEGFELDSFHSEADFVLLKGKQDPDLQLTIKMEKIKDQWLVAGCGLLNIPSEFRANDMSKVR